MKKLLLLILISISCVCHAQYVGLTAGQYSQYSHFSDTIGVINVSIPYHTMKEKYANPFFYISGGAEYTTGGQKMSGLILKPASLNLNLLNSEYSCCSVILGMDGGYLINFHDRRDNGVVFTPSIYADFACIFVKAGYDIEPFNHRSQYFIRFGLSFGPGVRIFKKLRD